MTFFGVGHYGLLAALFPKPAAIEPVTKYTSCTGGCGGFRNQYQSPRCWECKSNQPTGMHVIRGTLPRVMHNGGCSNQNTVDPHGKWVGAGSCDCNAFGRDYLANHIELIPLEVLEARRQAEKAIRADTPVPVDAPGAIAPAQAFVGSVSCHCAAAGGRHIQGCPMDAPQTFALVAHTAPFAMVGGNRP